DLAIGLPDRNVQADGLANGCVLIVSGRAPHATIRRLDGPAGAARFGAAIANVGDLSGDGRNDLAVGLPGLEEVRSYRSDNGGFLGSFTQAGSGSVLAVIGAAAPFGGERVLVIGAPSFGGGRVTAYRVSGGSSLWQRDGVASADLGAALAPAGDVDGDGLMD